MPPLISIIIPSYNHAAFLQQRLDSVFNQSYQNFEVILLDDCSSDNSVEVLREYSNHPKVSHLIINEVNSGSPFKQWKKGLGLSKGKYVWIAESDDFNELKFLENYMEIVQANSKIGLLASGISIFADGQEDEVFSPFSEGRHKGFQIVRNNLIQTNSFKNGSGILFLKEALEDSVIKRLDSFRLSGDWWLWVNILKNHDAYYLPDILTFYRKHDQASTLNLLDNPVLYKEALLIFEDILSWEPVLQKTVDRVIDTWVYRLHNTRIRSEDKQELIEQFCKYLSKKGKIKGFVKYKKPFTGVYWVLKGIYSKFFGNKERDA